ncbi:MAG: hypothetical protein Kow0065_00660 [Methylomicrobium sp.]
MRWWQHDTNLRRFIVDFVLDHVSLLRPGTPLPPPQTVMLAEDWWAAPLSLDSLELVDCATAFAQMLAINDSGLGDLLLAKPSVNGWKAVATASLERSNHSLRFRSSGSTGKPHYATLPCAHIEQEARFIADNLLSDLSSGTRLWSLVPAHHIYGFIFTMAVPTQMQEYPTLIDARQRLPISIEQSLQAGDIVVAVPDFWRHWLKAGFRLQQNVTAVSAAAPCETEVLLELKKQGANVIEIYGATETGGIGYRQHPNDPLTLLPHWRAEGERLTGRYHEALLPDHLVWLDDKRFIVKGRKDGKIQIGGINISPDEVAALLKRHEAVAEASVRFDGNRLKAYVVPKDRQSSEELITDLSVWLSKQLPATHIPKQFTVGSQLPCNEMGKLRDW